MLRHAMEEKHMKKMTSQSIRNLAYGAMIAALYALTQHWLATRGVRRFESIR